MQESPNMLLLRNDMNVTFSKNARGSVQSNNDSTIASNMSSSSTSMISSIVQRASDNCCYSCWCCGQSSDDDEVEDGAPPLPPPHGVIEDINTSELLSSSTLPRRRHARINLRDILSSNPQTTDQKQLFAMTGWNLAIWPSAKVRGTRSMYHLNAILEFRSVGRGEVQIKGVDCGLFLAMNRRGRLYGEPNQFRTNTVFVETWGGSFFSYLSRKYAHRGWYVGIKKSGKPKGARKTAHGQKAVKFLARHPYPRG